MYSTVAFILPFVILIPALIRMSAASKIANHLLNKNALSSESALKIVDVQEALQIKNLVDLAGSFSFLKIEKQTDVWLDYSFYKRNNLVFKVFLVSIMALILIVFVYLILGFSRLMS